MRSWQIPRATSTTYDFYAEIFAVASSLPIALLYKIQSQKDAELFALIYVRVRQKNHVWDMCIKLFNQNIL